MKKEDVILSCYSILRRRTPLDFDCGKLCGGKCCKGDDSTGMILFPGEENLIDENIKVVRSENGFNLAVCNGTCDRNKRPLACRIYPLFPLYNKDTGEVRVIPDFRADCELFKNPVKLNKDFIRGVRRAGKMLLLNSETKGAYLLLCDMFYEFIDLENKFIK